MGKTPFISNYQQATAQSDDDRQALLLASQATLKESADDEVALIVYSCVSIRDANWQQVISKLMTSYPTHAVARGWAQYSAFFANPAADATLQEALRRLLTYGTTDYTYQSDPNRTILNNLVGGQPKQSVFQWAAVADAARLQLGDTNPHLNQLLAMVSDSLLQEAKRLTEDLGISAEPEISSPDPNAPKLYEMLWDCRFCGTTKLLGKSQRFCPTCGAAQDPSWRYFPSDADKVYLDANENKFVGVDVVCASCGNLNTGDAAHCVRCGAPMEAGDTVRSVGARTKAAGEVFETEDLYARLDHENELYARGIDRAAASAAPPQKSGGMKRWQIGAIVTVVVGIVGFMLFAIFATNTETVSVTGHRWERTIDIQSVQPVSDSREGTCRSVAPADAYNETERRAQVDTERVQVDERCTDVQRDRGDGVVEEVRECEPVYENRPVMGQVCDYTVDRWRPERTVSASGGLQEPAVWPDANLRRSNCNSRGCEREGDRDEDYILELSRNGESFSCEVDEVEWRQASRGDAYTVEVGRVGGGERCNTLKRAQ